MKMRGEAPARTPLILSVCTQVLNARLAGGGALGTGVDGRAGAGGTTAASGTAADAVAAAAAG